MKIHGLRILHWNKGNSLFKNKIDDINFILDKYSQNVVSILEANYENIDRTNILDYIIETNDMGVGHDTSRQILLILSTIEYTQTYDYIDKYIAAIVIKTRLANRQTVTLIAHYRQWTLPLTPTDAQYDKQT